MGMAEQAQQLVTAGNLLVAMPVAAAAGLISFASPVSGVSGQDVEHGRRQVGRVLGGVALFGYSLVGGALLLVIGLLLVTGLWDSLLNQLRVSAGSVHLPL